MKSIYAGFVKLSGGTIKFVSCSDKSKRRAGELLDQWIQDYTVKEDVTEAGVLNVSNSEYIDIG